MFNKDKIWIYIGHSFFLILTIFAIVFAKERSLFNDSAYIFFKTVNHENFLIPHSRFSNYLFQWPLVLGIKLHLPLSILLYIYSMGYVLMYYVFWLTSQYFYKHTFSSIIIVLSLCCGISASYYHMVGEVMQGLVFCALFYASLNHFKTKILNYIIPILWMILAVFSHPSVVICILFIMGFYTLINIKTNILYMALMLLPFIALVYLKKTYFFSDYDNNFLNAFDNSAQIMEQFWQQYPVVFFLKYFTIIYWQVTVLFIVIIAIFIYLKAYLKLAYILISVIFFCIINNITFAAGDSDMMMERIYLPGIFIITFSYIYIMTATNYNYNNILKYVGIAIIVCSTYSLGKGGINYANRMRYVEQILQEATNRGYQNWVAQNHELNDEVLLADWGLAAETLLISSMKDKDHPVNIFKVNDYKNFDFNNTDFRASIWGPEKPESLNKFYFNLKTIPYKKWTTP